MAERRSGNASVSSSRSSSPVPTMMLGPTSTASLSHNSNNLNLMNTVVSSHSNNGLSSASTSIASSRPVTATNRAGRNLTSPYRNNSNNQQNFNPRLIFSQMVAIQCFHYVILGFLFQLNHVLFNSSITIDRIFTDKYLHLYSLQSWADNSAILFSSVIGAVVLAIIVEKSKKCLDFGVTLFLVHLLFCTLYNGVPATWDWWICHILGTIILILLGEYLCSRRELDDIPLLQL